jgi:hypothetical protein
LPGPTASVKKPKIGRPPPLNMAKNATRPAAVLASNHKCLPGRLCCRIGRSLAIGARPLLLVVRFRHLHPPAAYSRANAGIKRTTKQCLVEAPTDPRRRHPGKAKPYPGS